jgi:hypothetical protein
MTEADYASKWHKHPFILTDQVSKWPVYETWNTEYLLQNFPSVKFRAEALEWTLEKYISYMQNTSDESPLYLFDKSFMSSMSLSSSSSPKELEAQGFWPPTCFGEDLFTHLGHQRPDSTWMILGPERSGSTVHVDPNGTNAWNAVLKGSKYWLMFPPPNSSDPKNAGYPPGVIISPDASEITAPVSIPEYLLSFHKLARAFPGAKEGVCREGEILHVPAGWFHLVFNLSESLAITGNFVHRSRLPEVLRFMRDKPEQVSGFGDEVQDPYGLFLERLSKHRPELLEDVDLDRLEKKKTGTPSAKRTWEDVKGETDSGGFSFGFAGEESEKDIELPKRPKKARWNDVKRFEGSFSFGFQGDEDEIFD